MFITDTWWTSSHLSLTLIYSQARSVGSKAENIQKRFIMLLFYDRTLTLVRFSPYLIWCDNTCKLPCVCAFKVVSTYHRCGCGKKFSTRFVFCLTNQASISQEHELHIYNKAQKEGVGMNILLSVTYPLDPAAKFVSRGVRFCVAFVACSPLRKFAAWVSWRAALGWAVPGRSVHSRSSMEAIASSREWKPKLRAALLVLFSSWEINKLQNFILACFTNRLTIHQQKAYI